MKKRKKLKPKTTRRRKRKGSTRIRQQPEKQQPTDEDILTDWAQQLREEGRLQDKEMVIDPPDKDKVSDNLLKLLGSYTKVAETKEQMRKLIFLASAAWNASLLAEEDREEFLESLLDDFSDDMREFIALLIARKLSLFPDARSFILDYKIMQRGGSFHVSVVSTVTIEKKPRQ